MENLFKKAKKLKSQIEIEVAFGCDQNSEKIASFSIKGRIDKQTVTTSFDAVKFNLQTQTRRILEFLSIIDWFRQELDDFEHDYLIIDCPGQLELYTHLDTMQLLFDALIRLGYSVCVVYLLDSSFIADSGKFITGSLVALSTMARFQCPHINVITKIDQLKDKLTDWFSKPVANKDGEEKEDDDDNDDNNDDAENGQETDAKDIDDRKMKQVFQRYEMYFDCDIDRILLDLDETMPPNLRALNHALGSLLSDSGILQFIPLDITSVRSVESLMQVVDRITQYEPEEKSDNLEYEQDL